MQQNALKALRAWRDSPRRRPLVVLGPHQVGKTTLVTDYLAGTFRHTAYVSFARSASMRKVFRGSLDATRLTNVISAVTGVILDDTCVIVFDDVQECPQAVAALKSFREQKPSQAVVAIGSVPEDRLRTLVEFPDGKVDVLHMHPLTFPDFLIATDKRVLVDLIAAHDYDALAAADSRFASELRDYLLVGGMPKAVATWAKTREHAEVRRVQCSLLEKYDHYATQGLSEAAAIRVRQVWESIPRQLTGTNRKFMYNAVGKGARARSHQDAVQHLVSLGLVTQVNRVDRPGIPLASHVDPRAFRLFMLDVGMLAAAMAVPASSAKDNQLFELGNSALTQQYACQQLIAANKVVPRYWSAERSSGEVDFVYGYDGQVVPLQVCAEVNKRSKSLRAFTERYGLRRALRLSLAPYERESWVTNVPLYAASTLLDLEL